MINEERLLNGLEEVLNNKLTVYQFEKILEEFITNDNKSKYNIFKRTISSYWKMKVDKSNGSDFFANLRQLINTFKRRFEINNYIVDKFNKIKDIDLYLDIFKLNEEKFIINSRDAKFSWLDDNKVLNDFKFIYEKKVERTKYATGDYRLKSMTGFNSYKSPCQKFIIKALETQRFGTTILATMKTGGGKSLLVQYISKYESKGTTIVVLPTIALAIDQYESSKKYFVDNNRKVYAYYDGVLEIEKQKIFNDLIDGNISILYMSPESILNGKFYDKIMECAKKGILNRLVVDEAHLVADWGSFFRTEFQFLSVFRKKILRLTNGRLKTVLVSATITEKSQNILKNLYSEKDKFIEIRGDSLRDEISFYKIKCKNNIDRREKIREIIPVVPKPMIIYVPIINDAHEYYDLIKSIGFENIEIFTSETSSQNREKILEKWNNDKIDIIVATAAFGMGVDKKEVRSIVHTFIPESIDRFYQEVGRSGRDGFRSYSFLFTALKEDKEHIQYFTRNKVLLANKIVDRWNVIMKEPYEKISGDEYWISVRGIPEHLMDNSFVGRINENWNEYVILFLYRSEFIDILDVRVEEGSRSRLLHIKIKDVDLMNDSDMFFKAIEELRTIDREYVDNDIDSIIDMIKDNKTCFGEKFEKIYEYTEQKCSGCPACRARRLPNRKADDYFEIVEGKKLLTDSFNDCIEKRKQLVLDLDSRLKDKIKSIVDFCICEKVNSLILPNLYYCNLIIKVMSENSIYLYTYEEAMNSEESLLRGKIAIVLLKDNNVDNDKLYRKYTKQFIKGKVKSLIFISEGNVYIKSELRDIERCIDDISYIRR